jgi:hypothetical protein
MSQEIFWGPQWPFLCSFKDSYFNKVFLWLFKYCFFYLFSISSQMTLITSIGVLLYILLYNFFLTSFSFYSLWLLKCSNTASSSFLEILVLQLGYRMSSNVHPWSPSWPYKDMVPLRDGIYWGCLNFFGVCPLWRNGSARLPYLYPSLPVSMTLSNFLHHKFPLWHTAQNSIQKSMEPKDHGTDTFKTVSQNKRS